MYPEFGKCAYDGATTQEIINDFANVRGDISDPDAQKQMVEAIERNIIDQVKGLMSPEEHEAMDLTVQLWNKLHEIVGDDEVARAADLHEICSHIHGMQRLILAQAACRAFPDKYRLLGKGNLNG